VRRHRETSSRTRMTAEPFTLDQSDPAHAGQAIYTKRTLRAYDNLVVRFSNSFVWHCPARTIRAHYQRHIADPHLDIGPGTGYYLDRVRFPTEVPRITLLDPNDEVLRFAAHRLRRYAPMVHAADALKPIALEPQSFRSVGLGYVLHCLPGNLTTKAMVFHHVRPLVKPGGVIFGTTILHDGVEHRRLGRKLMGVYNHKGIFTNLDDTLAELRWQLESRFERHELDVVGSVALFAAWVDG
jgi:SAM-dependent methyltransferase